MPVTGRSTEDVCHEILELDPAIRVAAFVEGDEVKAFAQSTRASNALSDSGLKTKIGYFVRIILELTNHTAKFFGATESVAISHKGLKLVIIPLSSERSLGLSLDKSANADNVLSKVTGMPGFRRATSEFLSLP